PATRLFTEPTGELTEPSCSGSAREHQASWDCRESRRPVERRPSFSRPISREAKSMDGPSGYRAESTSCSASRDGVGKRGRSPSCRPEPVRSACWLRTRHMADWRTPGIYCSFAAAICWGRPSTSRGSRSVGNRLSSSQASDTNLAAPAQTSRLRASGSAAMVFRDSRYIDQSSFVWVNRQGRGTPTELVERGFRQPRLSRDGQRLLVDIRDGRSRDISIYDFRRSQLSRLTTQEGETPMWSPDESSMAWAGGADGKYHILLKRSDGSDAEHRIWSTDEHIHLNAWTPDGKSLLVNATHGQRQTLVEVTLQPSISARPFRESKFNEYGAAISPDGRRVAFVSDEAGHAEVYLTARNGVGKVQVSSAGGTEPVWSGDGRELFYRSGRRLMSVATGTAALDVGPS